LPTYRKTDANYLITAVDPVFASYINHCRLVFHYGKVKIE
jgi:hypothetical protein